MIKRLVLSAFAAAVVAGLGPASAQTDAEDEAARRAFPRTGPAVPVTAEQQAMELSMTQLLNRMAQLGFQSYQSFRREGNHYVVRATTVDHRDVVLRVDAMTGEVTQIR